MTSIHGDLDSDYYSTTEQDQSSPSSIIRIASQQLQLWRCPNCHCTGQCQLEERNCQNGGIDLQHAVEKMVKLNQENFDLRLHCYHLKEKLERLGQSQSRSAELDSSQQAYWEEETGRLRRELRDQDGRLREMAAERDSLQSDNSHLRDMLQKWEHQESPTAAGGCLQFAPSSSTPWSKCGGSGGGVSTGGGGATTVSQNHDIGGNSSADRNNAERLQQGRLLRDSSSQTSPQLSDAATEAEPLPLTLADLVGPAAPDGSSGRCKSAAAAGGGSILEVVGASPDVAAAAAAQTLRQLLARVLASQTALGVALLGEDVDEETEGENEQEADVVELNDERAETGQLGLRRQVADVRSAARLLCRQLAALFGERVPPSLASSNTHEDHQSQFKENLMTKNASAQTLSLERLPEVQQLLEELAKQRSQVEQFTDAVEARADALAKERVPPLAKSLAREQAEVLAVQRAETLARQWSESMANDRAEIIARGRAEALAESIVADRAEAIARRRAEVMARERAEVIARARVAVLARGMTETLAREKAEFMQRAEELVNEKANAIAAKRVDAIAKERVEVLAQKRAEVIAKDRAEVIAKERVEVIAKERAEVLAKDRAEAIAKERAEVIAKERAEVIAKARAEVIAKERAEVIATERAEVIAKARAEVIAKERAEVIATEIAEVIAKERAEVLAQERAEVLATERAEVIAKERAEVLAHERAEVLAKERAEVIAKDRAEVLAKERVEVLAREKIESLAKEMLASLNRTKSSAVPPPTSSQEVDDQRVERQTRRLRSELDTWRSLAQRWKLEAGQSDNARATAQAQLDSLRVERRSAAGSQESAVKAENERLKSELVAACADSFSSREEAHRLQVKLATVSEQCEALRLQLERFDSTTPAQLLTAIEQLNHRLTIVAQAADSFEAAAASRAAEPAAASSPCCAITTTTPATRTATSPTAACIKNQPPRPAAPPSRPRHVSIDVLRASPMSSPISRDSGLSPSGIGLPVGGGEDTSISSSSSSCSSSTSSGSYYFSRSPVLLDGPATALARLRAGLTAAVVDTDRLVRRLRCVDSCSVKPTRSSVTVGSQTVPTTQQPEAAQEKWQQPQPHPQSSQRRSRDFYRLGCVGSLEDLELLKRQNRECCAELDSALVRIDNRLRHYAGLSVLHRAQSADYNLLRSLRRELAAVQCYAEQRKQMLDRFGVRELAAE